MTKLFGTDGIRGKANHYPMNVETTLALGRAFAVYLKSKNREGNMRVVLGKDTRLSCYIFENALIAGLCSMGVDTLMVGPLPTPGVAFITRAYRADAGIVISASHNPFYDNGIKFFDGEGFKLPDVEEKKIEALVNENGFSSLIPSDHMLGKNSKIDDADGRYIEFVKATLPRRLSLKGIRVVLDCAHGASYRVAPLAIRELDAEVFAYGNNPNGLNINTGSGALFPDVIRKAVLEHRADVGIAFDGDADRVIMVDENGKVVNGDAILAICAHELKRTNRLQNNTVVSTVMCNYGFLESMKNLGIEAKQSKVGDRYVIEEMLNSQSNLGGEQSGHMIFLDYNTTGDGLVSALQVLRIMKERSKKLSELTSIIKHYPQELLNVKVSSKPDLKEIPSLSKMIKDLEASLKDKGRVLVRYSGTEPICRVMVEGIDRTFVSKQAKVIADHIKQEIGQ